MNNNIKKNTLSAESAPSEFQYGIVMSDHRVPFNNLMAFNRRELMAEAQAGSAGNKKTDSNTDVFLAV